MAVSMAPRGLSVAHTISVAADVPIAQVDNIMDHGVGATTLALSGADAASFSLSGRALLLKAGTVLVGGTPLHVTVTATNTLNGAASAGFILDVT